MSDPAFWTPPCSPKFGGDNVDILTELETDLFLDPILSVGAFSPDGVVGLCCGRLTCLEFLQCFEDGPPACDIKIDPLICMGSISANVLHLCSHQSTQQEKFTVCVHNDISLLLTALLNEIRWLVHDVNTLMLAVAQFRSVLLSLGHLDYKQNTHLFHVHLELWIGFLKLLDMLKKDTNLVPLVNSVLSLEPTSALDAYGYFIDICLENLASLHSVQESSTSGCTCISYLWILLIRYSEKVHSGWFKYLHGKLTKLAVPKKTCIYAPNTLERLRPEPDVYLTTDPERSGQSTWSLYWSLLAFTAPLHSMYMNFQSGSEVSKGLLQKYSVVIWLIRKQFLGESTLSEKDARTSLKSLLQLIEVWGANIEVVRLLWLYFSRKLDHGLLPIGELKSLGPSSNQSCIRFSDWLSKVQQVQTSALTSFELFCLVVRTVPTAELNELRGILKFQLRSLTRQALSLYFLLLGHFFDEQLSRGREKAAELPRSFATLVDMLSDQFPADTSAQEAQNWDNGRRCAALQGIHHLVLLCVYYWTTGVTSELMVHSEMNESFLRLVGISTALRQSLLSSSIPTLKPNELGGNTSRAHHMYSLGWRMELVNSLVHFGLDLMELVESQVCTQEEGLAVLTKCLDDSLFRAAGWPDHIQWNTYVKQLVSYVSRSSGENTYLRDLLWTVLYPAFKEYIERKKDHPRKLSESIVRELSALAFDFVHLSLLDLVDRAKNNVSRSAEHPLYLLEFFAMDPKVEFTVRFAFVGICFAAPDSLKSILQSLTLFDSDVQGAAWRLLTLWLAYCLLVRPAMEDRAQNHLNSFEHLSAVGSQMSTYFPADLAGLFGDVDAEMTLLSLGAKFDQLDTFQSKMVYKSRVVTHLAKLCSFVCYCCSPSSTARDEMVGLEYCQIPGITQETLCSTGYRAVSLLIRHCSSLLYSTVVTSGMNSSPLEQLLNNFVLPRQLYEWDKLLSKTVSSLDGSPLQMIVTDCMKDQLSEFTMGLAQLSWRSDAYIGRVLRDVIKLYYIHLDGECVAHVTDFTHMNNIRVLQTTANFHFCVSHHRSVQIRSTLIGAIDIVHT
ncbi:hypothetical protein CRM22_005786 [Opisthorchis felineus]|uniref:MMS22-like C-terminal domain-containing protein n=1 Tax=Opisthorchis felineus TaxID=147828 RepID=A0A4S2LPG3_OPIFE|nr:hypothetical protein CRM22_005786 [Opisthorchis felineus]